MSRRHRQQIPLVGVGGFLNSVIGICNYLHTPLLTYIYWETGNKSPRGSWRREPMDSMDWIGFEGSVPLSVAEPKFLCQGGARDSHGFTTRFKVWHRFPRILEKCLSQRLTWFECFATGVVENVLFNGFQNPTPPKQHSLVRYIAERAVKEGQGQRHLCFEIDMRWTTNDYQKQMHEGSCWAELHWNTGLESTVQILANVAVKTINLSALNIALHPLARGWVRVGVATEAAQCGST